MLRFDVNISFLFKEVSYLDRFESAASYGFGAVEFPWPGDENLAPIEERVRETRLKVVLMNIDYQGYIGLEYNPTGSSDKSFTWLPADRRGVITPGVLRL